MSKTVLDKLVERLGQITEEVAGKSPHDDIEQEFNDAVILLAGLEKLLTGLEKITGLLADTFNDIDVTLLRSRMNQEKYRAKLQDSLTTINTILMNYPDVFVRLDVLTVRMFLEHVGFETLKSALADMDIEVINNWRIVLADSLKDKG